MSAQTYKVVSVLKPVRVNHPDMGAVFEIVPGQVANISLVNYALLLHAAKKQYARYHNPVGVVLNLTPSTIHLAVSNSLKEMFK
jgi:hypothetical protein